MNARMIGTTAVAAAACAIAFAGTSWACGDKLVALGGGVGFERVMVSRNPGHIILMLEPETGLVAANDKFNLVASLSLAGHEVSTAKNAEELSSLRLAAKPDLIIVDVTRARQLGIQTAPVGAGPVIMPVSYTTGSNVPVSNELQSDCVTAAGGRKGAQLLKAVENALKLRSRGQPMPCEKSADSQQA